MEIRKSYPHVMEIFFVLYNFPDFWKGWILVTGSPLFNEHCDGLGFVMEV